MQDFIQNLGQVNAIIGTQWGDEGKGKVVDILAEGHDVIARACGGANAGHTIVIGGQKHVFHLLPSGCLHEEKEIILGSGMVIHLPTLLEEIATLKGSGIDIIPRLHIAENAHIVLELHKQIDEALEKKRAEKTGKPIGTTKRGIGPAYMHKAARFGVQMKDLLTGDVRATISSYAEHLENAYDIQVNADYEEKNLREATAIIGDCITDTVELIHTFKEEGKTILIEGAQATMLDLDHGTYPYVTSSSTTAAGALQGLGLPPSSLKSCIGVVKAYCTRVGEGDFPTELLDDLGEAIRERGGEYGATTGRPRRCGWLSLPDLKKAIQINGLTHLNLTKLDVLDELDTVRIAVDTNGDEPVYEDLPGWKSSTVSLTSFDDLPENAKKYIAFLEEHVGIPVSLIGTGPGRTEMIVR